jgi:hypothetical protein
LRIDLTLLREREDNAARAINPLRASEKWAALELLINNLRLRPLTQVDVSAEKIKAFRQEQEGK